ncbi:hypothetical protein N9O57_02195 [bacterium]|nr:hypothetical protein [bacterium]
MGELNLLERKYLNATKKNLSDDEVEGLLKLSEKILMESKISRKLREDIVENDPRFAKEIERHNIQYSRIKRKIKTYLLKKQKAKNPQRVASKLGKLYKKSLFLITEYNYRELGGRG